MAHGVFKDLTKRAASDKILRDKAFNIAKNSKYDGYTRGIASMVYKLFDRKTSGMVLKIRQETKKREVHLPFMDNNSEPDLANMQLVSKSN